MAPETRLNWPKLTPKRKLNQPNMNSETKLKCTYIHPQTTPSDTKTILKPKTTLKQTLHQIKLN